MTPAKLAARTNSDENELNIKLDNMACRGLLFRGKEQYVAWGDAHQLNVHCSAVGFEEPILTQLLFTTSAFLVPYDKKTSHVTVIRRFSAAMILRYSPVQQVNRRGGRV